MLNKERLLGMKIENAVALLNIEGLDFNIKETSAARPRQELSEEKIVIRVKETAGKVELTCCRV